MRKLLILLLTVPLLLASGCMDYEETLILNKDGSGSMRIHYSIEKAYLKQMQEMTVQMGGEKQSLSDMAAEMSPFDSMEEMSAPGVKIIHLKSTETDEAFIWDMKVAFQNFTAFNDMKSSMSDDEYADDEYATEEAPEEEMSYVKQDDGTWLFTRSLGLEQEDEVPSFGDERYSSGDYDYGNDDSYTDETPEEPATIEEAVAALGELGDGMEGFSESVQKMAEDAAKHTVRLTVQFPGNVIESNATKVDGNTAIWEYPLDKMMSAPPTLTATIED